MALHGALAEADRQGKVVLTGSGDLSVAGTLAVTTPFINIDAVSFTVESGTAPTTSVVTYSVSSNVVTFHGWKVTAANDTTLIASNGQETLSYTIIGRRR